MIRVIKREEDGRNHGVGLHRRIKSGLRVKNAKVRLKRADEIVDGRLTLVDHEVRNGVQSPTINKLHDPVLDQPHRSHPATCLDMDSQISEMRSVLEWLSKW